MPNEIKCRVLLKLPDANLASTFATSLRQTITAERQNGAVLLLKVNVLPAAQTYRHASAASRMVGVIEQPMFGRGISQLIHFTVGLEPKPHFLRAGVPQDQSPETS
jgi:hypothetical protein